MKSLKERWKNESMQLAPKEDAKKSAGFEIFKTDDDQHLVFGWASVAITVTGEELEDRQHDMIDPEDLEEAAYEYVLNFRDTGEEHLPGYRKRGKLVESCVFTPEKQRVIGIPPGTVPVAWWIGFKIEDEDTWRRIKDGTYKMFSIEGKAQREEVRKADSTARTFEEVLKFNPYHGYHGYFSTANGATSFTTTTRDPAKQHWADKAKLREQDRQVKRLQQKLSDDMDRFGEAFDNNDQKGMDRAAADWNRHEAELKDARKPIPNLQTEKPKEIEKPKEPAKPKEPKKPADFKKISNSEAIAMAKEMGQGEADISKKDKEQMLAHDIDEGWGSGGYFGTGHSWSLNEKLRDAPDKSPLHGLSDDDKKTVRTLDKHMAPASRDITVHRMIGHSFLQSMGLHGVSPKTATAADLKSMEGKVYENKGYTSTSFDMGKNVFGGKPVKLNIRVPKGAKMLISPDWETPWGGGQKEISEAEILLARGTAMVVRRARKTTGKWGDPIVEVDLEVLLD